MSALTRYFIDCDNSSTPYDNLTAAHMVAYRNYGTGALIIKVDDDGSVMGMRTYYYVTRDDARHLDVA